MTKEEKKQEEETTPEAPQPEEGLQGRRLRHRLAARARAWRKKALAETDAAIRLWTARPAVMHAKRECPFCRAFAACARCPVPAWIGAACQTWPDHIAWVWAYTRRDKDAMKASAARIVEDMRRMRADIDDGTLTRPTGRRRCRRG